MPHSFDSTELRVLLTGESPLARSINETLYSGRVYVRSVTGRHVNVANPGKSTLDVSSPDSVFKYVADFRPHVIVNTAQIGALQQCEADPAYASEVNSEGPAYLALAANAYDSWLVQFSTAYVFHGIRGPYRVSDPVFPVQWYGQSKLLGESVAQQIAPDRTTIVRLGWLYGPHYRSHASDVINLGALVVPADKLGALSYIPHVAARVVSHLTDHFEPGVFHIAPREGNSLSWYEVMVEHFPTIKPVSDTGSDHIHLGVIPRSVGLVASEGWEIPDPDQGLEDYRFYQATGDEPSSWFIQ